MEVVRIEEQIDTLTFPTSRALDVHIITNNTSLFPSILSSKHEK